MQFENALQMEFIKGGDISHNLFFNVKYQGEKLIDTV